MKRYVIKRLLAIVPVVLVISIITFLLINLAPGDPVELKLNSQGIAFNKDTADALRKEMGLNYPIHIQYINWLKKAICFDLGNSFKTGMPVLNELLYRLTFTIKLASYALIIAIFISIPLGIISALYKNTIIDHFIRFFVLTGITIPDFCLGLLLLYLFSVKMKIFSIVGGNGFRNVILPAFTLAFGIIAQYTRILRATMLEVLNEDFIKVARAKGLKRRWFISRYALKNSLIPMITILGTSIGQLLAGSVIVETIFSWPGIGKFVIDAISNRDYPVIQGFVIFMSVIFVIINLLVDISYAFIDPRVLGGNKNDS
ncbi:peptide/nickel transport system permease protein [Clostridium tetanomorphum]|uniref:Nickel import system permease protein NikB n=1 Tax=Clostridium tetanomorphum TaxID=1553 RepID=A0A923J0W9_CLOTT|nr:nickel ABC transporter permease [Clostridium tetanomorphum]KAJ53000.1 nickel transport system permease NikB [Clostridium tetanomorphum DSM 665]MBC2398532.1 ABC transporter permease [Clostridium tetanomorphum]MBP1864943.1 peptide/nickel transport system permease protein [Clostridium tetanomorphum]NRS83149.1 peptide/nickel transport system permease protein [Clostridium tetanomorphum]NRZ98750.1 peptide/nickel transport system permease protein [Clostridium tetanomorphum]